MNYRYKIIDVYGDWVRRWIAKDLYEVPPEEECFKFFKTVDELYPSIVTFCCWEAENSRAMREAVSSSYKKKRDNYKTEGFCPAQERLKDLFLEEGWIQATPREGEGDDMVATLCWELNGEKLIIGKDKDLYQLIDDDCHFFSYPKDIYTPQNFEEHEGIPCNRFMDFQSIAGDQTDGIAGVEGVGNIYGKRLIQKIPNAVELILADDRLRLMIEAEKTKSKEIIRIADRCWQRRAQVEESNRLVKLYEVEYDLESIEEDF